MSAVLPPGTESPLVCEVSEMGDTLNKTDVLLMAIRAALIAMQHAIEVYLDLPVTNRQSRRAK